MRWEYRSVSISITEAGLSIRDTGEKAEGHTETTQPPKGSNPDVILINYLNGLGREGWEMVGALDSRYGGDKMFFKRTTSG